MRRAPASLPWAVLALCVSVGTAAGGGASEPSAPPASARVVTGELTRVDLSHRSVFVKTDGREPRELEAATGPDTRVVSRGRTSRLEDLRPGDRVVLVTSEEGGRRLARVIKVMGRAGLPSPSTASPSPLASAPPPAPGSPG